MNDTPNRDRGSTFVLLDDAPSSKDELDGLAHTRVARALVDIIRSEDGGRAIGLEGTWGSGKSTVVSIAAQLLTGPRADGDLEYDVFCFDTWAHQGDPIRRTFLEELIEWLGQGDALTRSDWQDDLDRLRARIKQTQSITAPQLTALATFMIAWTPLIPLAILWLSPFAFAQSEQIGPNFILLALAVLIVPYGLLAITLVRRWWSGAEAIRHTAFAFLSRATDQIVTEQLIRDEEPTILEFNAIFDRLVADLSGRGHRLVIVLDNLDRLPADLIRQTWATMRNFFAAAPGTDRESVLRNVWLVVPFDRSHMEEVFAENVEVKSDRPTRGFLEKTFQVILRVSPPLLSHWRSYLDKQIGRVFGDRILPDERYRIFKLLELDFARQKRAVTPRAIKSFTNVLATEFMKWKDKIPFQFKPCMY